MKKTIIAALFCASVLLSACGSETVTEKSVSQAVVTPAPAAKIELSAGSFDADSEELSFAAEDADFALLDGFTALKKLDVSGSSSYDAIISYIAAHPDVEVVYTVTLPDGRVISSEETELDMQNSDRAALKAAEPYFAYLPSLRMLRLGDESEQRQLSLSDIAEVLSKHPDLRADYGFTMYGKSFRTTDTEIDLWHVKVEDCGKAVTEALACMPDCAYLDMDSCGVEDEDMAAIRDAFPNTKVVWRVWFGDNYSVRTDVEKILASRPTVGGNLLSYNTKSLKYCTDVKFIDVGHNMTLGDISFVAYMPKLEVAIVAMAGVEDATPLENCTNLEYLEIQTNYPLSDLSALAKLTNLKHLNIGHLFECTDMTPIYNLTKLERLMIGCMTPIPEEQVEEFRRRVPNCEIDTESYDPTAGTWRYIGYNELTYQDILSPRYKLLREQFGYDMENAAFAFYWNDPLYFDK